MNINEAAVLKAHRDVQLELLSLLPHMRTPLAIARLHALAECKLRAKLRLIQIYSQAAAS